MKVSSLANNQFIITGCNIPIVRVSGDMFQSYDSNIVFKYYFAGKEHVFLDITYWNYSKTTSKYRNRFLNETTKETQRKIDAGIYKLVNLN